MFALKKLCFICMTGCLCLLFSCHDNEKTKDYIVIDLENTVNSKGPSTLTLNDISESIRIIPTETNDSVLFPYILIAGEIEGHLITYTKEAVYSINKETGKVLCILKKQGQGPGEYNNIFRVVIDEPKNVFYIYSTAGKTGMYDFNGNFVKPIKDKSIGMFTILDDGNFAVSYPPTSSSHALGIYDTSWNLKRTSIPRKKRKMAILLYSSVGKCNNEYFYRDALEDTLYKITSETETPYLVIHKGMYRMPDEVFANLSTFNKERDNYITYDGGTLGSKYFFMSYYYDGKTFREIWDITNSEQIYKREYSEQKPEVKGILVTIGDVTVATWPKYVSGNTIYCVVEADDAIKLIPTLPEDTNPIILEVKIK